MLPEVAAEGGEVEAPGGAQAGEEGFLLSDSGREGLRGNKAGGGGIAPGFEVGAEVGSVPLAAAAIVGVGRGAEAEVVHAAPVAAVVAGLAVG